MVIMPSSCLSDNSKSIKDQITTVDSQSIDKLISDNPLIFRLCCFCVARQRKRVGTAKQNGTANHVNGYSSETILNIDQIEFTPTTPIAHEM
jgi:hypothetical protein